jgi:hypothetical protein
MPPNEPTITLDEIMIAMPVAHREVMAVLRDRALEAERRITELESDIAFARQRIVDLENDVASHPPSVPSAAELDRPSATRDVAVAQKAFNGVCRMDKAHSESLNEMLHAQGVGIIVRQLTDRLVPTLTIKVTDAAFDTNVKTTVSNSDQRTRVDGFEFTWFSSGRGNLTSRACLQDGGRTLYMGTLTPAGQTVAVEHKWFRALGVGADGKAQTFGEVYRYDPNGVEDAKSVRAARIFRSVNTA